MDPISTIILNIFVFIFGSAIGSFLNVLSDRLPNDESILGRSHCEKCKQHLSWKDLFPLLSFFFLKGKCRYCKTKLSFFYPLVEIVTGIFFVIGLNFAPLIAYSINMDSPTQIYGFLATFMVIVSTLIVIFLADLKYQIIPDSMIVVLLICAGIVHSFSPHFELGILVSFVLQGIFVMTPLLLLFLITRGRGMGFGDVKLAFVIGVLCGLKLGLVILYMSFILGALVGIFLILRGKKKMKSKIAFGPFIVVAIFIGLFFPSQLLDLIHRLWGI